MPLPCQGSSTHLLSPATSVSVHVLIKGGALIILPGNVAKEPPIRKQCGNKNYKHYTTIAQDALSATTLRLTVDAISCSTKSQILAALQGLPPVAFATERCSIPWIACCAAKDRLTETCEGHLASLLLNSRPCWPHSPDSGTASPNSSSSIFAGFPAVKR